jgi:hypothetical protein
MIIICMHGDGRRCHTARPEATGAESVHPGVHPGTTMKFFSWTLGVNAAHDECELVRCAP